MTPPLHRPQALVDNDQATLRAHLDAELYLIPLVERLSRGFIHIDAHIARTWSPWLTSLQEDPAFQLIKPALYSPEAWPRIWTRARSQGFSPATEHHNWIFFTRLFERAHEAERLDLARYAFSEAVDSLCSLDTPNYLTDLLNQAREPIDPSLYPQILATLFQPSLKMLADFGRDALNFAHWDEAPSLRLLSYLFDLIHRGEEITEANASLSSVPLADSNPLIRGLRQGLSALRESLSYEITAELDRRLQSTDLLEATGSELLTILDGALRRYHAIDCPLDLARAILRAGLAMIWDLREMEREEELAIFSSLLDRLTPLATHLEAALNEDATSPIILSGLEGTLADLHVFLGEDAIQLDTREARLRHALTICPGHRNASRLLSYLLIEKVNRELLKLSAIPTITTRVGPLKEPVQRILQRARQRLDEAATIFPTNKLIERYREDLDREEKRFQALPTTPEESDHESR